MLCLTVAASNLTAYYCYTDLRVQCSKISVVVIADIQGSEYQCDVKAFKRSVCAGVYLNNMSRFVEMSWSRSFTGT